jgi:hypothetical protein
MSGRKCDICGKIFDSGYLVQDAYMGFKDAGKKDICIDCFERIEKNIFLLE